MTAAPFGFADSLIASRPHPSLGPEADTYGRLIGSWAGTFHDHPSGGDAVSGPMEVHFAWALEGRAVQDTWIAPGRQARHGDESLPEGARDTYGSTLRVWDPQAKLWRVTWTNPARQAVCRLVGRRVGDDIVQTGYWDDRPQRWCFRGVTANAFAWEAHGLADDGSTWELQTRFELTRTA